MIVPEGSYACLRPGIVATSALTSSIKNSGYLKIWYRSSQFSDNIGGLCIKSPAVLTVPRLDYLKLRVITALPVQKQVDLVVHNGCNNLNEKSSQDPFARLCRGCRMVPGLLKVRAKPQ